MICRHICDCCIHIGVPDKGNKFNQINKIQWICNYKFKAETSMSEALRAIDKTAAENKGIKF